MGIPCYPYRYFGAFEHSFRSKQIGVYRLAEKGKHAWLIDSLQAMMTRIRDDFRLSREEVKKLLLEKVPGATDKQIEAWKQKKYLETRMIDGEERWFIHWWNMH